MNFDTEGTDVEGLMRLIQDIAAENDYWHARTGNSLEVCLDREVYAEHHTITPYIYEGKRWLKVSVIAGGKESVTLYSLRSRSDVIRYCQLLINAATVKSMRRQD